MNVIKSSLILIFAFFNTQVVMAQQFESGEKQVPLLELYTSEGCSSCPPADRWLSKLSSHEQLWSGFVPLAWHVDYWDYIGWKDPFASREYSQRQRRYAHEYQESTVYTPGVRKAGEEWRSWRLFGSPTNDEAPVVGQLRFAVDASGQFNAEFVSTSNVDTQQLNVAILGLDLQTNVKRGENRGKLLKHDFVVLSRSRFAGSEPNKWVGTVEQPAIPAKRYAIAVWVSQKGQITPLQATGGYLSEGLWLSSNDSLQSSL